MSPLPTSVVIVSRGRPEYLALCLQSLTLQDHPFMEVIVVADPVGLRVRPDLPLKRVAFDEANISRARNLGLAQAAGEIVAFIDDDAVAEPIWLSELTAPFSATDIVAATGWTRARDGFAWQVQSARITPAGLTVPLPPQPDQVVALPPEKGAPVSTIGTNCAFRREALAEIGGFDPQFSWHLDESDVNLRMARAYPHARTAIVPRAQVIHARAASPVRRGQAPVDLHVQGRSTALFIRRHGGEDPGLEARHRAWLLRHMVEGRLDPMQLPGVLDTLRRGLAEGRRVDLAAPPPPRHDHPPPFARFVTQRHKHITLSGWHWQANALRRDAASLLAQGNIVTLLLLTPSFLPHQTGLTPQGWFEQRGGIWGASEPGDPPIRATRRHARSRREAALITLRRAGGSLF